MRSLWKKFNDWCKNSGTIIWARLQMVVGAFWATLMLTDLSPVLSSKWLTVWMVLSGSITEIVRRSGTTSQVINVAGGEQMTVLKSTTVEVGAVSEEAVTGPGAASGKKA